jgi:trimeric autotransporter adhesin
MNLKLSGLLILLFVSYYSFAQGVGIGTTSPNPSAIVEISHSSKGLLIPRMSTAAINNISNPAKGLMVYDSSVNQLKVNMGTAGSPNWQNIVSRSGWSLTGNSGTSPANNFMGNTDNRPLKFRVNNIPSGELNPATGNVFWGLRAGQSNQIYQYYQHLNSNIGIGTDALKLNTRSNIVAIGDSALFWNGDGQPFPESGSHNTAVGSKTLYKNILGNHNTAIGSQALMNNSASDNTAVGAQSLRSNLNAHGNTAVGTLTMTANTTGFSSTAIGNRVLSANTTGYSNTALGALAMQSNVTGAVNTALGVFTLRLNIAGTNNVAIGNGSLYENLQSYNTGIGISTLGKTKSSYYNTALGYYAGLQYDLGWNNTIIGAAADGSFAGQYNMVAIGMGTVAPDNSTARIGNTATWSIGGWAGWSNFSDGRYKRDIKENVKGLDFIMKLRPVTYHLDITGLSKRLKENQGQEWNEQMKTAIAEKEKMIFTGFVAQEVEEAARQTGYDFSGVDKPGNENSLYALRYAEFVVPMVKAVQEQQQIINELKEQNKDLLKRIEKLESSQK